MAQDFLILQICLACVMLVATCAAGCAPLILLTVMKRKGKDQSRSGWLSYLSCFSGGVFMATCFLDIMPHIDENYAILIDRYQLTSPIVLSQVFICCGFFLVYLIEELTSKIFGSFGHGHSHGAAAAGLPDSTAFKNENITRSVLLDENHLHVRKTSSSMTTRQPSLAVEDASPWVVSDEKSNLLKSLTFAVAMSFHSLLEGFALGVQNTTTGIYALFFSLLLHKSIEAFSVGLQISKANSSKYKTVFVTILTYSMMTPIGSVLGTLLQSSSSDSLAKDGSILFLESLAAGTFIYVTFLEVLAQEKGNSFNSLKQLVSILVGFLVILVLQVAFGHDHIDSQSSDQHPHQQSSVLINNPISAIIP